MKPTKQTVFLPITELENYCDKDKFYCTAVVFSPETENEHFYGCPPYIHICRMDSSEEDLFFQIPEIVAYYAKTHPCYTMAGMQRRIEEGEDRMAGKIRAILGIK